MSHITHIIITRGSLSTDKTLIDAINKFLEEDLTHETLTQVNEYPTDCRFFVVPVYLAALNHLNVAGFMECFNKHKKDGDQVFFMDECENVFRELKC